MQGVVRQLRDCLITHTFKYFNLKHTSHPADLLFTHPSRPVEGVVRQLRDYLITLGRLLPPDEAMCMMQARRGWLFGVVLSPDP